MVLPDILKNAPFFKKIETKQQKQASAKAGKAKQAAQQRATGARARPCARRSIDSRLLSSAHTTSGLTGCPPLMWQGDGMWVCPRSRSNERHARCPISHRRRRRQSRQLATRRDQHPLQSYANVALRTELRVWHVCTRFRTCSTSGPVTRLLRASQTVVRATVCHSACACARAIGAYRRADASVGEKMKTPRRNLGIPMRASISKSKMQLRVIKIKYLINKSTYGFVGFIPLEIRPARPFII